MKGINFGFKRCFNCGKNYPLFLFQKNNRKYQREHMKGKVHNCRFCTATECYKTGREVIIIDNKFNVIPFKQTWFNWIKKVLK